MSTAGSVRLLIRAAVIVGIGMGGLFDGILFHQILQLHNMLSAKYPKTNLINIEVNMFWDGLFHAFMWLLTVWGMTMFFQARSEMQTPSASRILVGGSLFGWGIFNCVEGVVDHYILDVHHVVERLGRSGYDIGFLLSGVLLMVVGWLLMRSGIK